MITGAGGFLGSALVDVFRKANFPVRALVRASGAPKNAQRDDVEIVEGDMRDSAAVSRAVKGARYVVHAAADYRLWAPDPGQIITSNVDGTRVVMEAAHAAGVEKIVYTSSVATLRPTLDGSPADETATLDAEDAIGAYKRSKVLAERVVENLCRDRGLPAVIVNPSTPIGPRDVRPTPTGRIIVEAASGRMPAYVDTGLNLAHVDDVATGHLLALGRGRIGERYILGGQDVLLSRMLGDIARLVGRRPPRLELPRGLVYPIAVVSEAMAHLTGRAPFATRDGLRMAKYRMFFSCGKAERELGYRSRAYGDGLADAISWFRGAGYLR